MLLLTLRGTPVVYMGEEIGMADVPPPPGVLLDRVGRDAQRTPMQWTDAPGGGFTTGRPWLALGDTREVNVAAQRDDPGSLLTLYRRLIDLRAQSPALGTGTYRALDVAEGSGVLAYLRESEEQRLLIALDVGGTGAELDLPAFARGRIGSSGRLLLSTGSDGRPDETIELCHLVLGPGEGIIVEL